MENIETKDQKPMDNTRVPSAPARKEQKALIKEGNPCIDYAAEYKKQTGKDLETGIYTVQ